MNFENKIHRLVELRSEMDGFPKLVAATRAPLDEKNTGSLIEVISEASCLEEELMNSIGEADVIDGLTDPRSRAVIAELKTKIRLRIEEEMEADLLTMTSEEEGAAWDAVYDLIDSPKELLLNRRRAAVVVSLASIPQRIQEILDEAKTCYITNQRNGAIALGRMMLEHAIIDIGVRLGQFPEPESVEDFYKIYPPYARADLVLGLDSPARRKFRDLYRAGSQVIHSSHEQGVTDVAAFLEEVTRLIGDVCTANHRALQKSR